MIGGAALFAAALVPSMALMAAPGVAVAQASATQGALSGTVRDQGGSAVSGVDVTVTSNTQGFSRTLTSDADGNFRAVALPPGSYQVQIAATGFAAFSESVSVGVGGTTSAVFTLGRAAGAGATSVDEIVVVGVRTAVSDFDTTTTGLRVDVETLSRSVPIARSGNALALLAPGVTAGDAAFGGIPSISGSSAGENTFFVNGLNTTDFVSFLGGATVPFEFYETFETKTGGYSSEFGRGTGGVINATTKSGGNEWEFGITTYWEPEGLRNYAPKTYLALNQLDEIESWDVILEAGGPIIEDRLFIYGLYNQRYREAYNQNSSNLGVRTTDESPVYGGKVDFIIADGHRLEGTYFSDATTTDVEQTTFFAGPAGGSRNDGVYQNENGGDNWIVRYTGQWTDWLTTSLAYGETNNNSSSSSSEDINPVITDITGFDYNNDGILDVANALSAQRGNWLIGSPGTNDDKREMLRFDVDVYFDLFGRHHIRAGIDNENLYGAQTLSRSGQGFNICRAAPINTAVGADALVCSGARTGGVAYRYQTPFTAATAGARTDLIGSPRRVRLDVYNNDGSWESTQNAYYIQDSWEVTDRLTLNLGVRSESFENANIAGDVFVDIQDQIAPRIGATYDVFGDRTAKLFGFYGRYFLPVAVNTNQRLAGRELFFRDTYNLNTANGNLTIDRNQDGIRDDNDQPILGGPFSSVTLADGTTRATNTQVDAELAPMYVDEFILGYSQQFSNRWGDFTASVTGSYRDLGRAIDDIAIDSALQAYCEQAGGGLSAASCYSVWSGFHQYVLANPGQDVTVTLSGADLSRASGGRITADRQVTLSAADLRFPEPVREYTAAEFTLDRAFDGVWGGRVSYVWSKNEGNYEGALKSDNGQADPGLTQDYDVPGLADGAFGYLPNHREHSFKAYGNWQVTPAFVIGANVIVQSPRQFGCQGVHPETDPTTDDDLFAAFYGAASWYCDLDGNGTSEETPRGSVFESDWLTQFDLTFAYTISDRWGIPGEGVTLRADVFNVFNTQQALDFNEFGEIDIGAYPGPGQRDLNYRQVTAYQTPRFVRLSASIKF